MQTFYQRFFQYMFIALVALIVLILNGFKAWSMETLVVYITLFSIGGLTGKSIYRYCLTSIVEERRLSARYLTESFKGFDQKVIETLIMSVCIVATYFLIFAVIPLWDSDRLLGLIIFFIAYVVSDFNASNVYLDFRDKHDGDLL